MRLTGCIGAVGVIVLMVMAGCGVEARSREGRRVWVGMGRAEFLEVVRACGAVDLTPRMEVVGPRGEHPVYGRFWEFRRAGIVVEVRFEDERIAGLGWCSSETMRRPKGMRENGMRRGGEVVVW